MLRMMALLFVSTWAMTPVPSDGLQEPPPQSTSAWVAVDRANIRLGPALDSPVIGLLERGDPVEVRACTPGCDVPDGWALLAPYGALRASMLRFTPPSTPQPPLELLYGRVTRAGAEVHEGPSLDARVIEHHAAGHILAFRAPVPDEVSQARWLARVHGGFVQRDQVQRLVPSSFEGVAKPPDALGFYRNAAKKRAWGRIAGVTAEGRVVFEDGTSLRRAAVRLAVRRPRPAGIPADARWVHVDLTEQTLTAYEGDALVYATLVSTGKRGWETPRGLFQVWLKLRHGNMDGRDEPYHVEEVPSSMYFHRGVALHGAAWHDAFGVPVSHGCVNLSPKDAAWLFAWSPPKLPTGWHTLLPGPAELDSLRVHVEGGGADTALRRAGRFAQR